MNPMIIVVALLCFFAVAGLGLAFAGGGNNARATKRAQAITAAPTRATRAANRTRAAAVTDAGQRRKALLNTLKEQERINRRASVSLAARLEQAGLSISPRAFWIASVVFGAGVLVAGVLFRGNLLLALGLAVVMSLGPPRWIIGFLAKRTRKFTEAFADAIDIVVRGIRSGLPVGDCLKIIARESTQPLAGEFNRLVESVSMGMTLEQGLEKMYGRMPTPELRFFTIVLAIQSKTGGNLAEALANLSVVLRARKMMREKIKALSSEAKASALIIGCLPPSVVALISITQPSYMMVMFRDPRGQLMLVAGVVWMAIGIFVMRRMINFKF